MNETKKTFVIGPFTQLLPMASLASKGPLQDEALKPIENAALHIHQGGILSVGPFEELRKKDLPLVEIFSPSVVLPGFIDAHTHICFAGSRANDYALRLSGKSYLDISASGGGILSTVRKTRQASQHELVASLAERLQKQLRLGITTCEVKSGYALNIADEIKMLQAIKEANHHHAIDLIPTCLAAHTLPWEFDQPSIYLDLLLHELLPKVKNQNLSSRVDIFIEKGAFSCQEAKPYLQAAKKMGFSLCTHADQFSRGGALLSAELGALSADHLELSTKQDFEALAKSGTFPIVLPGASLGLGLPFAPAQQILSYNLPLVIASDWNPGSAPMGDLLTQAALLGAFEHLTMAETLAAITCRAALALDLHDRGSLQTGMRADFSIFPCKDFREILYHQGQMKPETVFIRGERVWNV